MISAHQARGYEYGPQAKVRDIPKRWSGPQCEYILGREFDLDLPGNRVYNRKMALMAVKSDLSGTRTARCVLLTHQLEDGHG